ncbi:MAG: type II toxin-antitoxin system VapC family toxin, partial [Pseudomonadota bacterium]
ADEIRLLVPPLWYFEVGNILARRYPAEAPKLLRHLRSLGLEESISQDRYETRAHRLATTYRVTFYDASYHALAETEAGLFVTADEKYLAKAGNAGHILQLAEWPIG